MTQPDVANPQIGTGLNVLSAAGATALPNGVTFTQPTVWVAKLDQAPQSRAIRGYFISGAPNTGIFCYFDNQLDDSCTQMGTATSVEYDEPHILARGTVLYVVLTSYSGRLHFATNTVPIVRVFYHNQAQSGY